MLALGKLLAKRKSVADRARRSRSHSKIDCRKGARRPEMLTPGQLLARANPSFSGTLAAEPTAANERTLCAATVE